MMVPSLMVQLDEFHPPFGQPTRQQTICGESPRRFGLVSIAVQGRLALGRKIGDLRHTGLHAVSHLVLSDPGCEFRVGSPIGLDLMQLLEPVEHLSATCRVDPRWVRQVQNGFFAGPELNSLVAGREKP